MKKLLLAVFANENAEGYLATYEVKRIVSENEFSEQMLIELADGNRLGRAFVLTDEERPKMVAFTYRWNNCRYIERYYDNPQMVASIVKINK